MIGGVPIYPTSGDSVQFEGKLVVDVNGKGKRSTRIDDSKIVRDGDIPSRRSRG